MRADAAPDAIDLCALDELDDPGSKGFDGRVATAGRGFFIVRRGGEVRGYVNVCPHRQLPLEFQPDRFLDVERKHILCSVHGAVFEIDDGRCIHGPCLGASLSPLDVRVEAGRVVLRPPGPPSA